GLCNRSSACSSDGDAPAPAKNPIKNITPTAAPTISSGTRNNCTINLADGGSIGGASADGGIPRFTSDGIGKSFMSSILGRRGGSSPFFKTPQHLVRHRRRNVGQRITEDLVGEFV